MQVKVNGLTLEITLADGMLGVAVDGVPKGSIRVQDPEPEPEPEPVDPVTPDTEVKVLPPGWEIDPVTKKPVFTNKPEKQSGEAEVKPPKASSGK